MVEFRGRTASPLAKQKTGLMEKTGVQVEEKSDERKTDFSGGNRYKTISFHPTEACVHALSSQAQKETKRAQQETECCTHNQKEYLHA